VVGPERVAGVELSDAMMAAVRDRSGDAFDLRLADAAALPFPEASFDVVLSVNTIYFWPDPARVVAEMTRVLKPGGRVVLGYRSGLVFRMTPLTWFGFRHHGDRGVARLLEGAGLTPAIRAPRSDERIAVGTKA
jgi:arsenite methyltransferase